MATQEDKMSTNIEAKDERDRRDYWSRWIKAAKAAARDHWLDAEAAWNEYEYASRQQLASLGIVNNDTSHCYPIYWASCKTIEPAYYSRTPKITTEKEFDISDPDALTGCLIIERLGKYLIKNCEFDAVMNGAVGDFIHADKTTTQIVYTTDTKEDIKRHYLLMQQAQTPALQEGQDPATLPPPPPPQFFDTETGEEWLGEVKSDVTGYFYETIELVPVNQKIYPTLACYNEILHTPEAKIESEMMEKAYYFCMVEAEARKRFPEIADRIQWKQGRQRNEDGAKDAKADLMKDMPTKYLEGWEIYSKPNKMIYWYSDQFAEDLLEAKPCELELKDFFPSPPFIVGSKPLKHFYPTPVYIQLRHRIQQLHDQAEKITKLISAAQRRCLVDGNVPELLELAQTKSTAEFIAVKNLSAIVEKNGISGLVHYLPVAEFVQSIQELAAMEDRFKNDFFEWFGVPDILRGATDPNETLGAQNLKSGAAHDRFRNAKKQIAELARNTIEMMIDVALQVFSEEKIREVTGYGYMEPEHQQRFSSALRFLRQDEARVIRIAIETDSMTFIDEELKAEQMGKAVDTVTNGLKLVAQMAKESPEMAKVGLKTVLLSLDTVSMGKAFQDEVRAAVDALLESISQPKEPAPDYERMKLDLAAQKAQTDMMIRARELDQKEMQLAAEARDKETRLYLEEQQRGFERQLSASEFELKKRIEAFDQFMQTQLMEIERFKATLDEKEKFLEEQRLASEQQLEQIKLSMPTAESVQATMPQQPQIITVQAPPMPPINVTVDASSKGRRVAKITNDEFGNSLVETIEMPEQIPVVAQEVQPTILGL